MKSAYFEQFGQPIRIADLPVPEPPAGGVVIEVKATGLCRSDWHGWMGHDSDVQLPHVPGHEFAGIVAAVGAGVQRRRVGERVTLPFCLGCGHCPQCAGGNQQVCDHYYQPGFTGWGSFAEYVAVPFADINLVALPDHLDFATAAILGCRYITAWRAVVDQGRTRPGEWVAVHACGGVGLSAVQIAAAMGAGVIAIDIDDQKLELARRLGATHTLNSLQLQAGGLPAAIKALTGGGAHVSLDALGSTATCLNSIAGLRKRGRHLQVGLMTGKDRTPPIPMGPLIANELEIIGSHGMPAHAYPALFQLIENGRLQPQQLLGKTVTLQEGIEELQRMHTFPGAGVTVIDRF